MLWSFCLWLSLVASVAAQDAWTPNQAQVAVPMGDGAALAADVFLPELPGRYPTILIQTPYNRKQFRPAFALQGVRGFVDREHYAYVVLDWRGFFDSKPAAAVARRQQGRDGYDAVEWIAAQPWSDGKVGTWGASALGKVQFMTAKEQPPHLTCCVPLVAAEGNAYEDFYENGVFREAHAGSLLRLGFSGFAALDRIRESTQLLRLLRGRSDQVQAINVPVFMITGWYDHGVQRELGTFGALLATGGEVTRAHTNVLIGPWGHSDIGKAAQGALRYDTAAGESDRMALRFFDYWLRDRKDNGWGDTPRLRWWQINEEGWHSAGEVSGPETHPETLYLHADGRIDAAAPTAAGATRTYVADPRAPVPTLGGANLGRQAGEEVVVGPQDQRPLESRPDVLVYTTEALTEPLRCHGSLRVGFTFALDRPDANFAIRLSDVWPDGRSMLVCDGIGRAKYRSGPEAGAPVTPGEAFLVTIGLPPVAITFPPGHRLRVSICGSNSPRFELNAHTGADRFSAADAVPVECTIYHDADRPATLALPVLN